MKQIQNKNKWLKLMERILKTEPGTDIVVRVTPQLQTEIKTIFNVSANPLQYIDKIENNKLPQGVQ